MTSIQAVFFDFGGTIDTFHYTSAYRIQQAFLFRNCLEWGGIHLEHTDEEIANCITQGIASYRKWNMASMIELSPTEIWSRFIFKDINLDLNRLDLISEELAYLYETKYYIREMRPELPESLEQIRQMGLHIGCISNTQSITQVPVSLEQYGIRHYFNPLILSSVYGRRKPDPSIFYYAARMAKFPTGACVYVGDKINRDIIGAQRAGFHMAVQIWHEYDDGEKDEGAIPDEVIHNMQDLIPILEKAIRTGKTACDGHQNCQIKAIFFDAGDILYYRPVKDRHFKQFLQRKYRTLNPDLVQERERLKDLAFQGKIRRHDYYEKLIRLHGIEDPQELAEGMAAISLDDNTVEIFEGVPETINQLKQQGYILGIITDTAMPFSKKLAWFDQHGFGRVWDCVISSKEMGIRKPSPSLYKEALAQTGVRPHEGAFVGHKSVELNGAKGVGLHTIAFNYDSDAVADVYIDNFCDLLKVPILKQSLIIG